MFKLKPVIALCISAFSLLSCSSEDISLEPLPLEQEQQTAQISSDLANQALLKLPVVASFNNAYKILTTDNEATGRKDPRNSDKYFVSLVNSAKKTLDGAFYDIQDPDITKAFIRAKQRGVEVRLVTDNESLKDKEDPTKPRQSIIDLQNAGITVKADTGPKLMHDKFMIVDNSVVWTGSMNITTSSIYHHNNNSILIRSPKMAENFNVEFKRMFEQNTFGPGDRNLPYPELNVSGISIRTFFSPGGGTKQAIINELKKAQKSIKFMAFSMTDKDMLQVMTEKKASGLKVEGVFDSCLIPQYSIYWDLKKAGVMSLRDGNQALMHHKVMIIDDETVITGSYNFSKTADEGNNENCIIIKHSGVAKQYNSEYYRIRTAAFDNKPIPEYDHPACDRDNEKKKEQQYTVPIKNTLGE